MKTLFTTSLLVALCATIGATAQTKGVAVTSTADSVQLSQRTEGNYIVRQYLVKHLNDSDYSIRYQINLSKLTVALAGNSTELSDLNKFVEHLMTDSLKHVKWIDITGYASPDGPHAFNLKLAKERAVDFKNYVDSKYGFSKHFDVKISSMADSWSYIREQIAQSAIPGKPQVLEIIDGQKWTDAQKEIALRRLPSAWIYLRNNILPQLRRVEMTINYGQGVIVEQRTMIPQPPAPTPVKVVEPCCVVDDAATGLIIITDESDRTFDKPIREGEKLSKAELKAARREVKVAEKLAKREDRLAVKMAVKAEKAARKIAKAEAKAERKAVKAIDRM